MGSGECGGGDQQFFSTTSFCKHVTAMIKLTPMRDINLDLEQK